MTTAKTGIALIAVVVTAVFAFSFATRPSKNAGEVGYRATAGPKAIGSSRANEFPVDDLSRRETVELQQKNSASLAEDLAQNAERDGNAPKYKLETREDVVNLTREYLGDFEADFFEQHLDFRKIDGRNDEDWNNLVTAVEEHYAAGGVDYRHNVVGYGMSLGRYSADDIVNFHHVEGIDINSLDIGARALPIDLDLIEEVKRRGVPIDLSLRDPGNGRNVLDEMIRRSSTPYRLDPTAEHIQKIQRDIGRLIEMGVLGDDPEGALAAAAMNAHLLPDESAKLREAILETLTGYGAGAS